MEEKPVLDREGNPTGNYRFDAADTLRALETIGKHKAVNAFKAADKDSRPIDQDWKVTIVHTTKEEYFRAKKYIEHNPQ